MWSVEQVTWDKARGVSKMTDRGLSSRNSFPKLDDKTPEDKKTTANPKGGRCWRMRRGGGGVGVGCLCKMQSQQNPTSLSSDAMATLKYAEKGRLSFVLM